jgi:hypothetical protein
MEKIDLDKTVSLHLPIGHLLVVWDVLSNRLPELPYQEKFTQPEKRAIWALEDLCENELERNGCSGRLEVEWNLLMEQAMEFVKTIPADFLD